MKLTGRAVLFNYMLEMDAADVAVLYSAMSLILNSGDQLDAVVRMTPSVKQAEVVDRMVALKTAAELAGHQIVRTRTMFADGGDTERGTKRMRGIDVKAFEPGEAPPVPQG